MKPILAAILSTLFFSAAAFAQTPAQIDVTSLTITRSAYYTGVSMTATGLPAPYQSPMSGEGGGTLFAFDTATASRVGDVFKTSWIPESGAAFNGFKPSGFTGDSKRVKFTLTGISSDIVIYPTILRKRKIVTLTVPATVTGKIEIYDSNALVAVDNEVNLKGIFTVKFLQYLLNTTTVQRRAFDFGGFTFSYTQ